jgi:hypothetical protein
VRLYQFALDRCVVKPEVEDFTSETLPTVVDCDFCFVDHILRSKLNKFPTISGIKTSSTLLCSTQLLRQSTMASESQLPAEEIEEKSSMASARPPMMSRPLSVQSTGSAGSRDRHMLVRNHHHSLPSCRENIIYYTYLLL